MEKEAIQQIIKSNDILLETTSRLVEVNRESLQMTQGELSKNKTLMNSLKKNFKR
jgi:DNA-binding response OmpR family regulator